ncbi:MAG: tagaturonate epimerase family protein, partial [Candidatus Omnitrophica bacterium]|nr:tagaturonate epimerase family protein [Candidatus Omnitrophota bacterium]
YHFFPVLAQQSIRELERTGRSFSEVLQSAILGAFQEGYTGGFGADADHIKDIPSLEKAIQAGFTFFTIDPSGAINRPERLSVQFREQLLKRYKAYWKYYQGKFSAGKLEFEWTENCLAELVLTYGEALEMVENCYHVLKGKLAEFDFEVSVDETSVPTTPQAHVFIADQLHRRGIIFHNLALRFPGAFEKAIDYKGDLKEFENSLVAHQIIREKLGPYKLSLHSGSDKFSAYPIFKKTVDTGFHIKSSGTSWIEAVKAVALLDRQFFLMILSQAISDFEKNAASYEISANPAAIKIEELTSKEPEDIFADFNIRQVIHIAYGSIIGQGSPHRQNFFSLLQENEEIYTRCLKKHLGKHLQLLAE